jgi:hypothetical protein
MRFTSYALKALGLEKQRRRREGVTRYLTRRSRPLATGWPRTCTCSGGPCCTHAGTLRGCLEAGSSAHTSLAGPAPLPDRLSCPRVTCPVSRRPAGDGGQAAAAWALAPPCTCTEGAAHARRACHGGAISRRPEGKGAVAPVMAAGFLTTRTQDTVAASSAFKLPAFAC